MTKKDLISYLALFVGVFTSCTDGSKSTKSVAVNGGMYDLPLEVIVSNIEGYNRIEGSNIGIAGKPSVQWNRYLQLRKIADNSQLVGLTEHRNPVVRCYAFQALASRNSNEVFTTLLKHLSDTSSVQVTMGCTSLTEFVREYFIHVVTPGRIDNDVYKLKFEEQKILDSLLLNDRMILNKEKQ